MKNCSIRLTRSPGATQIAWRAAIKITKGFSSVARETKASTAADRLGRCTSQQRLLHLLQTQHQQNLQG